ncbi:MAG TPA: PIN domain nuclease [Actinomycetota bacterium]|nr:PIN domain nuclease [Actinomycetota bacterium]
MILVDTSAWIHFLRGTDHPVRFVLRDFLREPGQLATTPPVVMEVLAGARSDHEAAALRARLLGLQFLPIVGLRGYEEAAAIHRACRGGGVTVRSQIDCLIAAVAIRNDASVLHADAGFEMIARHTPLRLEPLGS